MPTYKSSEPTSRPDFVEAGDYTVEVIGAEESISQKSHNEMIELKLKVEPSGSILFDNLVFVPNAFWKIDSFRASTGETVTPRDLRHHGSVQPACGRYDDIGVKAPAVLCGQDPRRIGKFC